jgi:hypothetical protein
MNDALPVVSGQVLYEIEGRVEPLLRSLNPSRSAEVALLSIEVAHVSFHDSLASWGDLLEGCIPSFEIAERQRQEVERAKQTNRAARTSTAVLIDDKSVPRSVRPRIRRFKNLLSTYGVDYVCMESELLLLAPRFEALLPVRVANRIRAFSKENSVLPCSADIAIWYALRLGLLDPKDTIPKLVNPISAAAKAGRVSLVANTLVSILKGAGGAAEVYEGKADRLLSAAFGPGIIPACLRIYYEARS